MLTAPLLDNHYMTNDPEIPVVFMGNMAWELETFTKNSKCILKVPHPVSHHSRVRYHPSNKLITLHNIPYSRCHDPKHQQVSSSRIRPIDILLIYKDNEDLYL